MAAQVWHKAPFLRFLVALVAGILLQWFIQCSLSLLVVLFIISAAAIVIYSLATIKYKYQFATGNGVMIFILLSCTGAILVWLKDIRHQQNWVGRLYTQNDYVVATIAEPLVEKTNSYKALATCNQLTHNQSAQTVSGNLLLYFKKDSLPPSIQYGSQIVFHKNLQPVKNSGNPGGFDYARYSLFQGTTHQVYLTAADFVVLPVKAKATIPNFIFTTRTWVVNTIKKFVPGQKESGLAEALLVGYKDELDKNLVQAYSNTGVVHIIAISGLHLGLIYWLLLWLTKPLSGHKKLLWLRLLLTISALWLFTLLAGAQPSVLRSAIMFTIMAVGQVAARRTSIYNTMALSAFVLLCINPFWLWDVGFQLSYSAVLSIIIFFKPIYHWWLPTNKLLQFFWSLTAVTIAAQLLTTPISIYHFHQMPLLFLLTNFVAVPLSSLILMGEIILCALFFIPSIASVLGIVVSKLIFWMNSYIEGLDVVPFSLWNGLSISIPQMIALLIFVWAICFWLMDKINYWRWVAGIAFCFFMGMRSFSFIKATQQKQLIVYNVPKHTAIDIMDGRNYRFLGDSTLQEDDFIRNFHLQPSRILHRVSLANNNDASIKSFLFGDKHIVIISQNFSAKPSLSLQPIDILILSKNPKLYISNLLKSFLIKQIVADGSVPAWKAALWKKDCATLNIPFYSVSEEGAFVVNL